MSEGVGHTRFTYAALFRMTKQELAKEIAAQTASGKLFQSATTTVFLVWACLIIFGLGIVVPIYEFTHTDRTAPFPPSDRLGGWVPSDTIQLFGLVALILVQMIVAVLPYRAAWLLAAWWLNRGDGSPGRKPLSPTAKTISSFVLAPCVSALSLTVYVSLRAWVGFSHASSPHPLESFINVLILSAVLLLVAIVVLLMTLTFINIFLASLSYLLVKSSNGSMDDTDEDGPHAEFTSRVAERVCAAVSPGPTPRELSSIDAAIGRRMEALDLQTQSLSGVAAVLGLVGILSLIVSKDQIEQALTAALVALAPAQPGPAVAITFGLLGLFGLVVVPLVHVFAGSYRELRILEIMREATAKLTERYDCVEDAGITRPRVLLRSHRSGRWQNVIDDVPPDHRMNTRR